MATANEKKALWFLALIALSGTTVRLCRGDPADLSAADTIGLARQIGRVDSVRALRHTRIDRAPRPAKAERPQPSAETPLDLDSATAQQIEALPGIGATLAKRLVTHRDSVGGFGEIGALCEVRGVRSNLIEKLRPLVTFTAPRRPLSVECGDALPRAKRSRETRTRQTR